MSYSDRMTAAHRTGKVFDFTRGDRFRRARLSAGYDSAQDFAELIGVSRNTVSGAENDRTLPRPIVIRAWALATGADSRWLETGEAPSPDGDGASGSALPQLDSNQQPFDYTDGEVSGVAEVVELHPIELDPAA